MSVSRFLRSERDMASTREIKLDSPAKLNLYLEVLNKRKDGYHNIRTIFERISLADKIIIRESLNGGITICSNSREIPHDSRNIVCRAAAALREDFNIKKGVDIEIKKFIPVGSGLGGGSSNAAATLLGLNQLWRLKLSRASLLRYAARLGSDVAFFIYGCSFALGTARGNKIKPLGGFSKRLWHIVVVPKENISTERIYSDFDRLNRAKYCQRLQPLKLRGGSVTQVLFNRLEEVTFKEHPIVKEIKERLMAAGLNSVLMSGSGSAVFGIVNSRREGLEIAKIFGRFKNFKVFVVRTL